jgi:tRNA(Ile)-lysidine synthase TilS/MesJ
VSLLTDHPRPKLAYHDDSCHRCRATSDLVRISEFGKATCAHCYPAYFRSRVRHTLQRYQMLRKGDTVGVAVSGGKDSAALLHALWGEWPQAREGVQAVHVDMGLGAYSESCREVVGDLTARLGVRLVVVRVADYGVAIAPVGNFAQCSVCGAVRRALLDRTGLREGWAAIATGHTLDDRLQQMLKRLLCGRLDAPRPVLPGDAAHPRRIKPLSLIPDEACEAYVRLEQLPWVPVACPQFDPASHRLKQVFDLMESLAPMSKQQLVATLHRVMQEPSPSGPDAPCPDCGHPTASGICPLCRLKRQRSASAEAVNHQLEAGEPPCQTSK